MKTAKSSEKQNKQTNKQTPFFYTGEITSLSWGLPRNNISLYTVKEYQEIVRKWMLPKLRECGGEQRKQHLQVTNSGDTIWLSHATGPSSSFGNYVLFLAFRLPLNFLNIWKLQSNPFSCKTDPRTSRERGDIFPLLCNWKKLKIELNEIEMHRWSVLCPHTARSTSEEGGEHRNFRRQWRSAQLRSTAHMACVWWFYHYIQSTIWFGDGLNYSAGWEGVSLTPLLINGFLTISHMDVLEL